ncbi:copper chaperone PCu(A)C [Ferrovibrio sp.]|uniref:copper chaperone PCu(A)C n=1 Tax=Ferrovibrio sp. TaxID=1917215 RepID=UPI001B57F4FA|nr:copper chaperone PCu(A)C [Ferrovibrio sp.]MBP7065154.1 copper chaperone PCu(A)C [Ferrovibrio sp.]
MMPSKLSSVLIRLTNCMKACRISLHASWRHTTWALVILILVPLLPTAVRAHTEFGLQINVDHVLIEPRDGTSAILKFSIQNNTRSTIHLLRIETPVASGSRIMFNSGDGRQLQLDSLGVETEQNLNFGTSHMWVELTGLRETLRNGMHVPLRLIFNAGQWVDVVGDVGAHHDH